MLKVKQLENGCFPYIEGYIASQKQNPRNAADEWDYFPEEILKDLLQNLQGQHANTGLGSEIFKAMRDPNGPTKWVEVGAWNGKGTTLRLLMGAMEREEKKDIQILSYEGDRLMFEIAKENLENHPFYGNFFFLVHGRIPGTTEFPSEDGIPQKEKEGYGHFKLNYEREKAIYLSCPQINPPFLPEAIILDGGEYTGYLDWQGIEKTALRYVFLDDVGIFKHKRIYEELLKNPEWELIREDKMELNGWAVFRKI